jgi:hypothetical protein
MTLTRISHLALGVLLIAGPAVSQEKSEPERPAPTPLIVELVFGRGIAGKQAGTLTYSFPCNTRDRKTLIKSGVEVPVPVRKAEAVEYQYRNVGTNIECESAAVAGGRFSVRIGFEQSSLVGDQTSATERTPVGIGDAPAFRTSMSQFTALLRDGERAQFVSGTDPATGQPTTVEVKLTVVK